MTNDIGRTTPHPFTITPDPTYPIMIPDRYTVLEHTPHATSFKRKDGMTVIASVRIEADDKQWLHLSCAHKTHLPDYRDLCDIKRIWCGKERKAVMVFPPASQHVNDHPYCLHLYQCLDADPLPDFRLHLPGGLTTI